MLPCATACRHPPSPSSCCCCCHRRRRRCCCHHCRCRHRCCCCCCCCCSSSSSSSSSCSCGCCSCSISSSSPSSPFPQRQGVRRAAALRAEPRRPPRAHKAPTGGLREAPALGVLWGLGPSSPLPILPQPSQTFSFLIICTQFYATCGRCSGGGSRCTRWRRRPTTGESRLIGAVPMENPYCSCKLTVRAQPGRRSGGGAAARAVDAGAGGETPQRV